MNPAQAHTMNEPQIHDQNVVRRHRVIYSGVQFNLRALGILSLFSGFFAGVGNAMQYRSDTGFFVLAEGIGDGIVWCVLLFALAAIVDALRVIAAASLTSTIRR